jgi:hypothetical protein
MTSCLRKKQWYDSFVVFPDVRSRVDHVRNQVMADSPYGDGSAFSYVLVRSLGMVRRSGTKPA